MTTLATMCLIAYFVAAIVAAVGLWCGCRINKGREPGAIISDDVHDDHAGRDAGGVGGKPVGA